MEYWVGGTTRAAALWIKVARLEGVLALGTAEGRMSAGRGLRAEFAALDIGHWALDIGQFAALDIEHWALDIGHWTLDSLPHWTLVLAPANQLARGGRQQGQGQSLPGWQAEVIREGRQRRQDQSLPGRQAEASRWQQAGLWKLQPGVFPIQTPSPERSMSPR
eukprot:364228-Chlamydomonas_euryale.AAC.14